MTNSAQSGHLQRMAIVAAARYGAADNHNANQILPRHGSNAEFVPHRRRVVPMVAPHKSCGVIE